VASDRDNTAAGIIELSTKNDKSTVDPNVVVDAAVAHVSTNKEAVEDAVSIGATPDAPPTSTKMPASSTIVTTSCETSTMFNNVGLPSKGPENDPNPDATTNTVRNVGDDSRVDDDVATKEIDSADEGTNVAVGDSTNIAVGDDSHVDYDASTKEIYSAN
jgi:hypothetical protein